VQQMLSPGLQVLQNVKFIREKKFIQQFFDEIAQDSGKYCFGVEDTLRVRRFCRCFTCLRLYSHSL
jgi:peptide chain release factor subunit 1